METVTTGQQALVRVAVATLWASPEAVRPIDLPALASRTDIAAWVDAMTSDQRMGDCVLSQLLLGERVLVRQIRPDGWAQVVAVDQPADRLDPDGYPGWLPVGHLIGAPAFPDTDHPGTDRPGSGESLVVDATVSDLYATPGGPVVVPGVVLGTRLTSAGPTVGDWRPVWAAGNQEPLWMPAGHLVPTPVDPPTAVEVLAVASRLRDVHYLWGGVSSYGIDCSGLVHLAWRRFGVRLPRDADDQAGATTPVPLGDERPGDVYLFARPGARVHHIAIVTAPPGPDNGRRMLHACYRQRRVLEEAMSAERAVTLVAAHRIPSPAQHRD